jgi:hypothetical protein
MSKDAYDYGLNHYYDLIWDNVTKSKGQINQQAFIIAISELEMILLNYIERIGITEYCLRVQELLCQLRIMLKEAQNLPYDSDLELLEYILSLNCGISLFNESFQNTSV